MIGDPDERLARRRTESRSRKRYVRRFWLTAVVFAVAFVFVFALGMAFGMALREGSGSDGTQTIERSVRIVTVTAPSP